MKKLLILLSVFISLFVFSVPALADSPITSTHFSDAYMDIDIVKEASKQGSVNAKIAAYLSNSKNPIDVKAAVINALSWDVNGNKTNADKYSKLIYKTSVSKLKLASLRGDQLFCIGYLKAMDNYDDTKSALKDLKAAEKKINNSFTVSAIRSIVEAQSSDSIWKCIQPIINNGNLKKDMREDAVHIILDYMACEGFQVSQNNMIIENEKSQKVYLYGAFSFQGEAPYQLVAQSDKAYTSLSLDKYNIGFANITGVKNGNSSISIKNNINENKKINFTVVSSDTYKCLGETVCMYIGSTDVLKGKSKVLINGIDVPYIKNNTQYVPISFVNSAIGAKMQADAKKGTSKITYSGKIISIKSGSNVVSINGKTVKLESKIETKNKQLFISAKDYASITGKKYIYYNGLILFTNTQNPINAIDSDYILDEIISIINRGNSVLNYPVVFEHDGKYGYKYKTGKVFINPIFDIAYEFSEGLAAVGKKDEQGNTKCGYINLKGEYVFSSIYDVAMPYVYGLAPVILGENAVFIDKNGNEIIAFDFGGVGMFRSGLAPVMDKDSGKWGYINIQGKLIIPYNYDECRTFSEGLATVKINDKWGYIDRTGKVIIEPTFNDAGDFINGTASVNNDGVYSINKSGKLIAFFDGGDVYVGEHNDGVVNGKGYYTWADGSQYYGDFVNGHLTGIGTITTPQGVNQTGSWTDGEYVGEINK